MLPRQGQLPKRRGVDKNYQYGAYALEFALVFPLLFLFMYGLLTFGLIMTAQQSLNFAAESGARAALIEPAAGNSDPMSSPARLQARADRARQVAADHVQWLSHWVGSEHVRVSADLSREEISVGIVYDYVQAPLIPRFAPDTLFSLVVPEQLKGHARINLLVAGEVGSEGGTP
ncbi:pilus assembly protein [Alcaligenes ammonioxydans]|uniref:TadE family protein n=1 Tax=Alcaligenes TaxID=507 RepID=UPI000269EDB5|nr:TadE family protein [Alcaligenes ammonioxydans]EJC65002.1 TadE family protein [Alcaligenes faecalis subsp. faecalis NCIB 8687]QBH18675.1 pilus assembly protein [Alcaligenes faecalis]MCH1880661.1 pilus assembly protein [Alcaligenes ammonioxydans]WGQ34733.1 pilus assembly protein [Alcaligenes faecalis]HRK84350.1 pilus assembly protein [Alcaligenes faecalis]